MEEKNNFKSSFGVQFNEQQNKIRYDLHKTPKMVKLFIKLSGGLIKNEKQANITLLGLSVAMIIFSLFLVFGGKGYEQSTFSPPADATAEELIQPEE